MAINPFNMICERHATKSICSAHSSKASSRILKISMATDGSIASSTNKSAKLKKMSKSPYYSGDRVQLLSRVTEKRTVHKKTTDFVSSFPLAANIYKANSDEFKSTKKTNKKVKKSVLTLPNDPAPMPQVCTVSDMNDSEYCDQIQQDRKQKVIKKRIPIQMKRKVLPRDTDLEFYDRECSKINIDSSSTDIIKNFNGDGMRSTRRKKATPTTNKNDLSDVWAVLRNMNRLQFRPSPPMSEESNIVPVKKKAKKKRTNRKDRRVFETCRTEEFAYIQSYEVDGNSHRSHTPASSIDRITVIDKKNEIHKICQEFEERLIKAQGFLKDSNTNKAIKYKNHRNANAKIPIPTITKENKQLPLRKKKKLNYKSHFNQPVKCEPKTKYFNDAADLTYSSPGDSGVVLYNSSNEAYPPTSIAYSDISGSSNAESPATVISIKNQKPIASAMKELSVDSNGTQVNGISKIVLGKPQPVNALIKNIEMPKRKARLVTTMPTSNTVQKLAHTEIRRRLNRLKFPIVILGKDQVCSNIQATDCVFPQFDGLDKHIWPFMVKWTEQYKRDVGSRESKPSSPSRNVHCLPTPTTEIIISEHALKERNCTPVKNDLKLNKKKTEVRPLPPEELIKEKAGSKKQKSIVQLKDKMLNFLYKKSPSRCNINESDNQQTEHCKGLPNYSMIASKVPTSNKVDTNKTNLKVVPTNRVIFNSVPPIKRQPPYAHPWAKARWASEFIENVIKKIKNGVYYTQDNKDIKRKHKREFKEASVQAGKLGDSSDYTQTYKSDTEFAAENYVDKSIHIPGFDDALPALEITTFNPKEVAVRNRVTNIIVQFDISVPVMTNHSSTSLNKIALIPLEETESQTKIFKCKTTILNAILPAELCTILPKMMNTIVISNEVTSMSDTITDSCLSTISEVTREAPEIIRRIMPPLYDVSPELRRHFGGRFLKRSWCLNPRKERKLKIIDDYLHGYRREMLPKMKLEKLALWTTCNFVPELSVKPTPPNPSLTDIPICDSVEPIEVIERTDITLPACTTVVEVQTTRNETLKTTFNARDLMKIVNTLISNHNMQICLNFTYSDLYKIKRNGDSIQIDVSLANDKGEQKNVSLTVNNLKIDSFEAVPKKPHITRKSPPIKYIEYEKSIVLADKLENTKVCQVVNNKIKRKGFHRIYKKCKSTSNIPVGEKLVNTPLSKIVNLEDFFEVLGAKKMLSSVIDGYAAKKVLSSIMEMKNWITEINPRQALLILLLTNKKDTPNLVRFRPVLLQGIAVNRITRAAELDMEIEVIERENLNKFSQYEGISYLPETVTNYDNLLEELYWIAKTTASDYQRPFDECSEKLLRSLLEKRKKLNPSYLRVMARYVGLGLLKSPKN